MSGNALFRVAWLVVLLFSGAYTPNQNMYIMHIIKKHLRANFQSDPILPISHTALFSIILKAMLQFQICDFPAFSNQGLQVITGSQDFGHFL